MRAEVVDLELCATIQVQCKVIFLRSELKINEAKPANFGKAQDLYV